MSDTKGKIKEGIDDAASKGKQAVETVVDKTKNAGIPPARRPRPRPTPLGRKSKKPGSISKTKAVESPKTRSAAPRKGRPSRWRDEFAAAGKEQPWEVARAPGL